MMLNGLETAIHLAAPAASAAVTVGKKEFEDAFQRKYVRYDKGGEEHYNIISAFIKSIRGSDPDAAVYWLARMLEGGEDPKFIARRLIILASEDIGNAVPNALTLTTACFTAVDSIGMPEARIVLAQVATFLASCPKSNAAYRALSAAEADVRTKPDEPVPLHLRNAPTGLMKSMHYGEEYKYSHDFDGHFTEQDYLPGGAEEPDLLRPLGERRGKEHPRPPERMVEEEATVGGTAARHMDVRSSPSRRRRDGGRASRPGACARATLPAVRPTRPRTPTRRAGRASAAPVRTRPPWTPSMPLPPRASIPSSPTPPSDSIVYALSSRTMFLFGRGDIRYKELSLKAQLIDINWTTSILNAQGTIDTADSTGKKLRGLPELVDGAETYRGETIAYNFKSKKGEDQPRQDGDREGALLR